MEININLFHLIKITVIIIVLFILYYYSPCISLGSKKISKNKDDTVSDDNIDEMIKKYMQFQDEEMQYLDEE